MGSFSFGAGNAAKLARIPLYALGRLATLLIPRTDGWVFGCGAGIGDGPLELWREEQRHGVSAVWLVDGDRDAQDAAALGIPTLRKHSIAGFLATARAGVIVVSHGFGDVNPYAVSGAFIVQLWHGIPLKRIGLDSPETVRSRFLPRSALVPRLLARMYRYAQARISLLPAASHLIRGRLESAFGLPDDRIVVSGEPRVDVLSRGTAKERTEKARELLEAAVGVLPSRVLLYAPTWRDGDEDPAVPSAADWGALTAMLERQDAVLLIRSHPLGAGAYSSPEPTERIRLLGSDVMRDVTPALPAVTGLITDYSSLAYDAGLVPMPVHFLVPDLESYAERRGFYARFRDVADDDYQRNWAGIVQQIDETLSDETVHAMRIERSERLSAKVHAFRDGCNTQRVHRAIERRRAAARRKGRR